MRINMNIRSRVVITLILLVGVSLIGAGTMIWYTFRVEGMVRTILTDSLSAFQTAEALEASLVNQKGYVSYYVMDKDPGWLRQLGEWRQVFRQRLSEAIAAEKDPAAISILKQIDDRYTRYVKQKDVVLNHYSQGNSNAGFSLHEEVREEFFKIISLCESYKNHQSRKIDLIRSKSDQETRRIRQITVSALVVHMGAGFFLAIILIGQVLAPIKRLAEKTKHSNERIHAANPLKALSENVEHLLKDAGEAHHQLEKSRENLIMAEKLALVGKLAAGMAHTVRNPLTSIKMRLFSLNRTLSLDEDQAEDLMVISEEIEHIDTVVQNFLEFSRPPKLQFQLISPSSVVDMAIQLMAHRLKSYDVSAQVDRRRPLPRIKADPDQLKEVFVNLMENACQAMGRGGQIFIDEQVDESDPNRLSCVILVKDTGPGMDENVIQKAFQPFFTTKEEGTGLGLSIAERVIENHGGNIRVSSIMGRGTTFTITLPASDETILGDMS